MKYSLNQHVFTMDSDKPAMKKVIGIAVINEGTYYVLNKDSETEQLSSYNLYISDTKLKWVKEGNLFETLAALQKHLFGDME